MTSTAAGALTAGPFLFGKAVFVAEVLNTCRFHLGIENPCSSFFPKCYYPNVMLYRVIVERYG